MCFHMGFVFSGCVRVFIYFVNSCVFNNAFQMGSVLFPCVCDFIVLATLSSGCVCFCFPMDYGFLDAFVISCVLLDRMFSHSAYFVFSMDFMFVCMSLCFNLFC